MSLLFDKFGKSRFERFKEFHSKNPQVFKLFERFADEARSTGRRRYFGARMIGERIRWYTAVETTSCDFKINNDFFPYYARLLMAKRPEFAGFFERRDKRFDVDDRTLLKECA